MSVERKIVPASTLSAGSVLGKEVDPDFSSATSTSKTVDTPSGGKGPGLAAGYNREVTEYSAGQEINRIATYTGVEKRGEPVPRTDTYAGHSQSGFNPADAEGGFPRPGGKPAYIHEVESAGETKFLRNAENQKLINVQEGQPSSHLSAEADRLKVAISNTRATDVSINDLNRMTLGAAGGTAPEPARNQPSSDTSPLMNQHQESKVRVPCPPPLSSPSGNDGDGKKPGELTLPPRPEGMPPAEKPVNRENPPTPNLNEWSPSGGNSQKASLSEVWSQKGSPNPPPLASPGLSSGGPSPSSSPAPANSPAPSSPSPTSSSPSP